MFHNTQNPLEPEYSPLSDDRQERYNGFYETGNTTPPKRHGPLLACVLVLAVLCGSIISSLAHEKPNKQPPASTAPVALASGNHLEDKKLNPIPTEASVSTAPTEDAKQPEETTPSSELHITDSPESVPNTTQEGGLSLQEIYQKASPSAVSISATSRTGKASGSGIIMSETGYIITNCHVVEGASDLTVSLYDGRSCDAQLIGKDTTSDLAVLKISAQGLTAAEFGDSDRVQVGDIAVAIGDPLGIELRGTMTEGIISAINRNLTIEGRSMTLLQTTAALNEGNSGGPLINCYGQVVGINTAKIGSTYRSGVEGLGFAIPINTAKEIVDQLISTGFVPGRPSLGVETTVLEYQYRVFYDLPEGLYVSRVERDSPAWNTGLRKGDTILSIDGNRIRSQEDLNSILSGYKAGDTVNILIYRSRRQYQGELVLQEAVS